MRGTIRSASSPSSFVVIICFVFLGRISGATVRRRQISSATDQTFDDSMSDLNRGRNYRELMFFRCAIRSRRIGVSILLNSLLLEADLEST